MDIGERKRRVLQIVVDAYIQSAAPVGSALINQNYMSDISSATIRNDMAELERLGYLHSPHTSAGRVPSQSGYRFYVDSLMEKYRLSAEEMIKIQNTIQSAENEFDRLIRDATDVMSILTDYTTVVMTPQLSKSRIKKIELVRLDAYNIVIIIFADNGLVRHNHIKLTAAVGEGIAAAAAAALNREFVDVRMNTIDEQNFVRLIYAFSEEREFIAPVLKLVMQAIDEMSDINVYLYGISNIFNFPEYADIKRAGELFNFLQNTDNIIKLFENFKHTSGVQVLIGEEIEAEEMRDCSIVMSRYLPNKNLTGMIGVVGPTRMNYSKTVSSMEYLIKHLDRIISKNAYDEDNKLIVRRVTR